MSAERDLISKIILERDLATVADSGVNANFFLDPDHRNVFKVILEHQKKYSQVPTLEVIHDDYPMYRLSDAENAMGYYVDKVVSNYRAALLEEGLAEAVDLWEQGDYSASEAATARTVSLLNQEIAGSRVVDLTLTADERIARYKEYGKGSGLKGISSGFQSIDAATGGFQKKQLITFVGPPKAGKSTIMLLAMMAAHRGFFNPLFIGFEMSNEEQEERHDSILAGISHKKLREGRLSREEMQALEKSAKRLELMPPLIFSEDANSTLTLSGVASQVERYKPDILFVDGVYMMDDEEGERKGSPQALTNITRGFKQMAKNMDLAVAISTQVLEWKMDRKRGVTSSSIGYSSSFIQDSDQVIAVEKTDDEMINKIKVVLGRNNPGMETFVLWNWETGEFTELEDPPEDGEDGEDPKF